MPLALPILAPQTSFPAFTHLNNITLEGIHVASLPGTKGLGLISTNALSNSEPNELASPEPQALLRIPKDVVLSKEFLDEQARVDASYRELRDVAGQVMGKTFRITALLFLLQQITIASEDYRREAAGDEGKTGSFHIGVSGPWTEYVRMLPTSVPVPTMWSEEERELLVGTSLEAALDAKMSSLEREFDVLCTSTSAIPWCQTLWWDESALDLTQWILLDAWFRSRSLELPHGGPAKVPCLDMANHSYVPNAYYEETEMGDVLLLLRPGVEIGAREEVTISYDGEGGKIEAEMVFTYGFMDADGNGKGRRKGMTLSLDTMDGDPLGKAKSVAFEGPPVVKITVEGEKVEWECQFLYLMVLNEEDGLEFRVLQQTDGTRSLLRVFWQEVDVTDRTAEFENLISGHELKDVFKLRVVALLEEKLRQQLERLSDSEDIVHRLAPELSGIAPDRYQTALALRSSEETILVRALTAVEQQKAELLGQDNIRRYLGMFNDDEEGQPENDGSNEEEDFS